MCLTFCRIHVYRICYTNKSVFIRSNSKFFLIFFFKDQILPKCNRKLFFSNVLQSCIANCLLIVTLVRCSWDERQQGDRCHQQGRGGPHLPGPWSAPIYLVFVNIPFLHSCSWIRIRYVKTLKQ